MLFGFLYVTGDFGYVILFFEVFGVLEGKRGF